MIEIFLYIYILPILLLGIVVMPCLIRQAIKDIKYTYKNQAKQRTIDVVSEIFMDAFMVAVEFSIFITFIILAYHVVLAVLGLLN